MGFEARGGTAVRRVQGCEGTPCARNDDSCEPLFGMICADAGLTTRLQTVILPVARFLASIEVECASDLGSRNLITLC